MIIYFLLIQAIAALEGYLQAFYYYFIPADHGHPNLHLWYGVMRTMIAFPMMRDLYYATGIDGQSLYGIWQLVLFGLAMIFSYSFLHNGVQYWKRHNLNPSIRQYSKGFWSNPDASQSNALFDLTVGLRSFLFVLSIFFIYGILNN